MIVTNNLYMQHFGKNVTEKHEEWMRETLWCWRKNAEEMQLVEVVVVMINNNNFRLARDIYILFYFAFFTMLYG